MLAWTRRRLRRRRTGDAPNLFRGSNCCFALCSEFCHRNFAFMHDPCRKIRQSISCPGHRMSSDTRAPLWPPRNVNYKRTRFRAPSGGICAPGPSSARSRGGGGRGLTAFTLARDVRSRPLPRQSRRTQLISSARPIRNHCLGASAAGEGQAGTGRADLRARARG